MKKKLLTVLIIIISIFGILKYKNYDIKNLINEGLVSINSKYGDLKSFISKGNLIKKFKSAKEAAEELNGNYKFIRNCAAGYKKSAYGYIWKYE